jgi:hypothetical protein
MIAVYIIAAIIFLAIAAAAIIAFVAPKHMSDAEAEESRENCAWFHRRLGSEPCRTCERGSKYEKSNFEEQEWD